MTLALTHLRMIAFRSYARLDLDLQPGIIALAGANGAGKTNILEAVSLLSPGRGLRRAAPGDFARKPEEIGWAVTATLATRLDPVELWTGADDSGKRVAKRDGKAASVLSLGSVARVLWLTPALDRVFVEGPAERRRFLDRMTLSLNPGHAAATVRFEKAMRERNRLLKDGVTDARWLGALEGHMAEAGVALALARQQALDALLAAQGGDQGAFPRAEAVIEGGFNAVLEGSNGVETYARLLADERGRDAQAGRTLVGPHRSDLAVRYASKNAPAADCSTGEQKALLVSLLLANARAIHAGTGAPPILLLDEIAAHFDATRREALFAEIAGLGAQAWMTGTEWPLFEALPDTVQRFSVFDADGASSVKSAG